MSQQTKNFLVEAITTLKTLFFFNRTLYYVPFEINNMLYICESDEEYHFLFFIINLKNINMEELRNQIIEGLKEIEDPKIEPSERLVKSLGLYLKIKEYHRLLMAEAVMISSAGLARPSLESIELIDSCTEKQKEVLGFIEKYIEISKGIRAELAKTHPELNLEGSLG